MEKEQILNGIKERGIYDFIASNYWQMSKEQLKDVILELDYATYSEVLKTEYETIKGKFLNELDEKLF